MCLFQFFVDLVNDAVIAGSTASDAVATLDRDRGNRTLNQYHKAHPKPPRRRKATATTAAASTTALSVPDLPGSVPHASALAPGSVVNAPALDGPSSVGGSAVAS